MVKRIAGLSVQDVADRYGVTRVTVWRWIKEGKLRANRLVRSYRVTEEQIRDFEHRYARLPD